MYLLGVRGGSVPSCSPLRHTVTHLLGNTPTSYTRRVGRKPGGVTLAHRRLSGRGLHQGDGSILGMLQTGRGCGARDSGARCCAGPAMDDRCNYPLRSLADISKTYSLAWPFFTHHHIINFLHGEVRKIDCTQSGSPLNQQWENIDIQHWRMVMHFANHGAVGGRFVVFSVTLLLRFTRQLLTMLCWGKCVWTCIIHCLFK